MQASDVVAAFRAILGRDPESEAVAEDFSKLGTIQAVVDTLINSAEFALRWRLSPLAIYASSFNPICVMLAHEDRERRPLDGHVVNFLGVALDPSFVNDLAGAPGTVENVPVPANWHADISEFGAALRAVDLAAGEFTVIELGCGWGCWMNNTGVAARRRGLKVHAIGIEGDPGHIAFARRTLLTNGFQPSDYTLIRGVAAVDDGTALFPKQNRAGESWGLAPVFLSKDDKAPAANVDFDELPAISLATAIGDRSRIDLLHVDIQGGEAQLLPRSLDLLVDRVAYLVVGTHSREIDGLLMEVLGRAGWILEIERPTVFGLQDGHPVTHIDGVQGWRNPRF